MSTLTTSIQCCTDASSQSSYVKGRRKERQSGTKGKSELSLFADDMILHIDDLK